MGREYGGEERREDTVDLPVAIEPVRPIISMFAVSAGWMFYLKVKELLRGIWRENEPREDSLSL